MTSFACDAHSRINFRNRATMGFCSGATLCFRKSSAVVIFKRRLQAAGNARIYFVTSLFLLVCSL